MCFRLHTCPTPRPSHHSWFCLPSTIWWSVQIVTGLQSPDFVARMPTGVVIQVARSDGIKQNANECEHLKRVFPLHTQQTHQNWDQAFWQEEFLLFRYLVRWRNLPPCRSTCFDPGYETYVLFVLQRVEFSAAFHAMRACGRRRDRTSPHAFLTSALSKVGGSLAPRPLHSW